MHLLGHLPWPEWRLLGLAGGATLGRVLLSTAIGTVWAVPAGLAIGLSPRLSRMLQPVVQVVASFPAPMLFPLAIALLHAAGVGLGAGSILLMLLGTQWYILFNVIAGRASRPRPISAKRSPQLPPVAWRTVLGRCTCLPSFPYLVTGWVTAAGGAWNASIVAEYVTYRGSTLTTFGLGVRDQPGRGARPTSHGLAAAVLRHVADRGDLQPGRLAALLPPGFHSLLPDEVRRHGH